MTDLYPEWRVGAISLTTAPYLVPFGGVDYGSGENVTEILRSLLQDGDIEVSSRTGNRTLVLPVLIEGADMAALAEAESALAAECDKPLNEVYVDPGDGFGPPFIFEVFRGQVTFSRDDTYEQHGYRSYTLTFRARPFPRSVTATTVTPTGVTIGTARQKVYPLTVGGSARTQASLTVGAAASLGEVLVYSYPDDGRGYSPPLRQYATAATTAAATTDASLVSGKRNMLDTQVAFDVPAATLHDGHHLLVGLVRLSGVVNATVSVGLGSETRMGATVLAGQTPGLTSGGGPAATFTQVGSVWRYVVLGSIQLPMIDVGDPSVAVVRVTLVDQDTSGVDIDIDEAWLLNVTIGDMIQVDCGTGAAAVGGPSRYLFTTPPSMEHPAPRLLRGHTSDMSDAFNPGTLATARMTPRLLGGSDAKVLVVTPNTVQTTSLTASWFDRWHTHSAD